MADPRGILAKPPKLNVPPFSSRLARISGAIFITIWFGVQVWAFTALDLERRANNALISVTPEYLCLAIGTSRVSVDWRRLTTVRDTGYALNRGTLKERSGTDCVSDGEFVTYVVVSDRNGPDTLLRVLGRGAVAVKRLRAWPDVMNKDGSKRWRNDGLGYREMTN